MGYLSMFSAMESKRDVDGQLGAYRREGLRALARAPLGSLFAGKNAELRAKLGGPCHARVIEMSALVAAGAQANFIVADQAVTIKQFDKAYARAVESCDMFSFQKSIVEMNARAARIGILCGEAGLRPSELTLELLRSDGASALAREFDRFRDFSEEFALLLAYEFSRHIGARSELGDFLGSLMRQLSEQTKDVLKGLTSVKREIKATPEGETRQMMALRMAAAESAMPAVESGGVKPR